jgi:hypothetical protein
MGRNPVRFIWADPAAGRAFRTGVSLHGHTLHSKECLAFLPTYLAAVPGMAWFLRSRRPAVDFARAWWTPPLAPAAALELERKQIASLDLAPLVSLTDHDDIEAGMGLQAAWDRSETPVSVEWTVPYEGSIFHLGIHNLPPKGDRAWMAAMEAYTLCPAEAQLPELLAGLAALPDVLIVLNHPFWLEEGVTEAAHARALPLILSRCNQWFHAFELNGTRPWKENRDTIDLAAENARPVISGGDRHACEPSACINLTNAASFAEFTAEIRAGSSEVLFMPQYQEPLAVRILQAVWDILRPYPEYPERERWTDRVFYQPQGHDHGVSLSALWNGSTPLPLRGLTGLVELAATTKLRSAFRLVAARGSEIPL